MPADEKERRISSRELGKNAGVALVALALWSRLSPRPASGSSFRSPSPSATARRPPADRSSRSILSSAGLFERTSPASRATKRGRRTSRRTRSGFETSTTREGGGRDACRRARRFVRLRQRREAGRAGHEAPRGPPRPLVRGDQSRRTRLRDGSGSPDAPPMGPSPFARHRPRGFLLERRDGERERRDVQHAEAAIRPRAETLWRSCLRGRRPAVRPHAASTQPSGRAPISGRSSAAPSGEPRNGSKRRRGP